MYFLPRKYTSWYKVVKLLPPSSANTLAKWTDEGLQKIAAGLRGECKPIVDYEFDDAQVQQKFGYYRFLPVSEVCHRENSAAYVKFQSLWCLQKRLHPMVPCPENTPLPNRRMAKESRAKILSVYLRPWTLAKALATDDVPYITDLAVCVQSDAAQEPSTRSARAGWRSYLRNVLPHAQRGIRSFMLTCLAEGRGREDEDEKDHSKGPDIVCSLSLDAVHDAIALRSKADVDEDESYTQKLVIETAQRAAQMSQLSVSSNKTDASVEKLCSRQIQDIASPAVEESPVLDVPGNLDLNVILAKAWKPRYDAWCKEVYKSNTTPTPTDKQRHVATGHFDNTRGTVETKKSGIVTHFS